MLELTLQIIEAFPSQTVDSSLVIAAADLLGSALNKSEINGLWILENKGLDIIGIKVHKMLESLINGNVASV